MIYIALCDDEAEQLNVMERLIDEHLVKTGFKYKIERFSNGNDLIDSVPKERVIAVFLDIDMPGMNGIEVARCLIAQNKNIWIFFVSNYEEMVFEAIHVRPMRFIRKKYIVSEMSEAVLFLIKQLESENSSICFAFGKSCYELKSAEILCVESEGHYLRIITETKMVRIRGKISDYVKELVKHSFVQVQKGILLNMRYISGMKGDKVFMGNGVSYTMSRGKRDEIRKEFLKYMRKEL